MEHFLLPLLDRHLPNPLSDKPCLLSRLRYVPRSIMLDLEPSVLDEIYSSSVGAPFKPDAAVRGTSGAGSTAAEPAASTGSPSTAVSS